MHIKWFVDKSIQIAGLVFQPSDIHCMNRRTLKHLFETGLIKMLFKLEASKHSKMKSHWRIEDMLHQLSPTFASGDQYLISTALFNSLRPYQPHNSFSRDLDHLSVPKWVYIWWKNSGQKHAIKLALTYIISYQCPKYIYIDSKSIKKVNICVLG